MNDEENPGMMENLPQDIELMKYMLENAEIPYEVVKPPDKYGEYIETENADIFFNEEGELIQIQGKDNGAV